MSCIVDVLGGLRPSQAVVVLRRFWGIAVGRVDVANLTIVALRGDGWARQLARLELARREALER